MQQGLVISDLHLFSRRSRGEELLAGMKEELATAEILVLNGDCANRRMDGEGLSRFRETWSKDRQRGSIARTLYDGADAVGASRKTHDWWFPQLSQRRMR